MIKKFSSETKENILEKIVDIHKRCILETNSKYYNSEQIGEWISSINIQNIKDQLNNSSWIIIKEGNNLIGFAQYSIEDKEIYQIQIDPLEQGKGYGKKLYEYIEKQFRKNNIPSISLFATLNATLFYNKIGFKSVEDIEFQLTETKIKMTKMIKQL